MRLQIDLWVYIISSSNLSLDPPVYLSIDICPSPSNRAPTTGFRKSEKDLVLSCGASFENQGIVSYGFFPPMWAVLNF